MSFRSTEGVEGFGYNLASSTPAPGTPDVTLPPASAGSDAETGGTVEGESSSSEGTEMSWWVAAVAGAGVGLGVLAFGALLFVKLGKRKQVMGGGWGGVGVGVGSRKRSNHSERGESGSWLVGETKQEPSSY